ncbi:MAG: hypothetical protein V4750_04295 [Pseudomonadota bacterium]
MTPSLKRLHLATRIHFALLRELGEGIDVGRMLKQRDYADEVLHVCRSVDDYALIELADRFDDASASESARNHMAQAAQRARAALKQIPRRAAETPQDMRWSDQTSGFGLAHALADLAVDSAPSPQRHATSQQRGARV